MGIALVNSTLDKASGSVASKTVTIPATTAGNLLVVAVSIFNVGTTVTVTDNKSGGSSTYTADATNLKAFSSNNGIQFFYLENCAAGITAVTFNFSPNAYGAAWVGEYSGVLTASAIDDKHAGTQSATTAYSAIALTTSAAGDLVIGAWAAGGGPTLTAGAGYTLRASQTDNSTSQSLYVVDKIAGGAGSETPTATASGSTTNAGISVAFKATAPSISATITEQNLPSNHAGNITVHVVGTATSFSSSTTWTASGVSGWSVASKTYVDATHYTVVLTPPTAATPPAGATGTLTLTEGVTGTVAATTVVGTPTLARSPTSGGTGSTPTVTFTETNTLWASETAAGLFTVTGGTGASLATPTVSTNTSATDVLTVGTATGTLTLKDTSTGATCSFTATAPNNVVVFLGNSTTYGYGVTGYPDASPITTGSSQTYPARAMEGLGTSGWDGYVVASSGYTIPQMQTLFFDAGGGTQNSHYRAGATNVVCILGGGSDLGTQTGTVVYGQLSTFAAAARAAGWKVIVLSAIPYDVAHGASGSYAANRASYHSLLDAGWGGILDGYARWHFDARIGPLGSDLDATYYQSDSHPAAGWTAIVAPHVVQTISKTLVSSGGGTTRATIITG